VGKLESKKVGWKERGHLFPVSSNELDKRRVFQKSLEVVSKPSIGLKVKADWDGQPQEYREYFEDWVFQSNTEIKPEGGV